MIIIVVISLGINMLVIKLYFLFLNCYIWCFFKEIGRHCICDRPLVTKSLIIPFKYNSLLSFLVCVNTTLVHPLSYVSMIHKSQLSALKTNPSELKMTEKAAKVQRRLLQISLKDDDKVWHLGSEAQSEMARHNTVHVLFFRQ